MPLSGTVPLYGAKNLALQAIAVSLLTDKPLTLQNIPRINDILINLEVIEQLGAYVTWQGEHTVEIDCADIQPKDIDPNISVKTTASKYFIPLLVNRFGELVIGAPGGDDIGGGDRKQYSEEILDNYKKIGIGCEQYQGSDNNQLYRFYKLSDVNPRVDLGNRYFGTTVQTLFASVIGPEREIELINPNIEPEVFETVSLLNAMGAEIKYEASGRESGTDRFVIHSRPALSGATFRIMSDPNALMTYIVMALITDSKLEISNIDHSYKVDMIVSLFQNMNADIDYNQHTGKVYMHPSLSRLKPINLETGFWNTNCHTDWQQILTPLLGMLNGESYIDENIYPNRFTHKDILNKMGLQLELITDPDRLVRKEYQTDGQPHTLKITGPGKLSPVSVHAPNDIRGATGVLAAMLAAEGTSTLSGAEVIERGIEHPFEILQSLGADIRIEDA